MDAALVAKRLDEIMADLIANGPTADEVQRVATTTVSGRISGLESVGGFGGKAVALASGELYSNDPGFLQETARRNRGGDAGAGQGRWPQMAQPAGR